MKYQSRRPVVKLFLYFIACLGLGYVAIYAALAGEKRQVRILVIDTGIKTIKNVKLCKTGHHDFVQNLDEVGYDWKMHGEYVNQILAKDIRSDINYCVVEYKYFMKERFEDDKEIKSANQDRFIRALAMAATNHFDYVNITSIGYAPDSEEKSALDTLVASGARVFVAAGNEGISFDQKKCNIYPPCYKNGVHVVGAKRGDGNPTSYSNRGAMVEFWMDGNYYDHNTGEVLSQGTSFATPRALARDLNEGLW